MKLVFAGTPAVATPTLRALVAAGHEITLVLTREDAPRGRKRVLTESEVAEAASTLGLPVLKANRITNEVREQIAASGAELGVVVAYGVLFREDTLSALPKGWINLHFSLLPAWRGAAPVQHNLISGGPTGVSVFQLDPGVDSGPLWRSEALEVSADATAGEVLDDFAERGAPVVLAAIEQIAAGHAPSEQHGEASRAGKLSAADGLLNPNEPARTVYARFRGVTPEPGAYILLGEERIKIIEARLSLETLAPGELQLHSGKLLWGANGGALELRRVQPAGKAAMAAADWWRGRR